MSERARAGARVRRLLALGVGGLYLLVAGLAAAQYQHRVVVLEPKEEPSTLEVRARLRGELSGSGFDVVTQEVDALSDPKSLSETAARELQPAAVLFVVDPAGATGPHTAEIWLSDRLLRRTFVLTYTVDPIDPGKDTKRVAVQVVEILKADLAELSVTRPPPPPPREPPHPPPAPEPAPLPPPPPRLGDGFRFEAGAGLLTGFDGLGSTLAPLVRLGVSLPAGWLGHGPVSLDILGSVTGLGSQANPSTVNGSAHVRQAVGTLGLAARLGPTQVVQPMLSLTSGAYFTSSEGNAEPPFTAEKRHTWSGVSGAGAGVWLQPTPGFGLSVQVEVLEAWSRTVIQIAGEPAATAGSPLMLVSASAAGVL